MGDSLFRTNIEQGLGTLNDLYCLGDASLYPLIERLHYHFHEIESARKKDEIKENKKESLKNLEKIFLKELNSQVKSYFRAAPQGSQISLINSLEEASLSQLDDIIETFPLICEATQLFKIEGDIKIWLYNDCFSVQGVIPQELDLESLRNESYILTRRLFQNNVLLTFKVFETNNCGDYAIKFMCHLKNSENPGLVIPLAGERLLKLSGMMENFLISAQYFFSLEKHQIYFLNNDLTISSSMADQKSLEQAEKEWILFHFPFLFRPLSLIIKRSSYEVSSLRKDTEILDFDLFSLIQN